MTPEEKRQLLALAVEIAIKTSQAACEADQVREQIKKNYDVLSQLLKN